MLVVLRLRMFFLMLLLRLLLSRLLGLRSGWVGILGRLLDRALGVVFVLRILLLIGDGSLEGEEGEPRLSSCRSLCLTLWLWEGGGFKWWFVYRIAFGG